MPKNGPAGRTASQAAAPTPARRDLAEAQLDLRAAERDAQAARAPVARLQAEIASEATAKARLDALTADFAARMAAWANGGADAQEPDVAARRSAEDALAAAAARAEAARTALAAAQTAIAAADRRAGDARARIRPAVAAALREEGRWIVAEYWRRYAELELARRELAALDQLLIVDFPLTHPATGRPVVEWISPDKQPAHATLHAANNACAALPPLPDLIRTWRGKAKALGG